MQKPEIKMGFEVVELIRNRKGVLRLRSKGGRVFGHFATVADAHRIARLNRYAMRIKRAALATN